MKNKNIVHFQSEVIEIQIVLIHMCHLCRRRCQRYSST